MQEIPVRHIHEPQLTSSFKIVKLDNLLSEKDMVQGLHRHDFYFGLFLKEGKGEHIIDFNSFPVSDYTMFFMRPGQVHQLTLEKGSTGYLIQFNRDFYSAVKTSSNLTLRNVGHINHCKLNSENFTKLEFILASICQEQTLRQDHYLDVIQANLEILFVEIVRQCQSQESVSKKESSYSQERLEELLELLQTNISVHKQVAEYAEMMHLSSFQINRITKEILGKTCSQVINDQILLEAKRSLLGTSTQINQIALNLGYEHPSYFIRFFKKHMGVSPEVFRNNFK